jgi:hypothetical protein
MTDAGGSPGRTSWWTLTSGCHSTRSARHRSTGSSCGALARAWTTYRSEWRERASSNACAASSRRDAAFFRHRPVKVQLAALLPPCMLVIGVDPSGVDPRRATPPVAGKAPFPATTQMDALALLARYAGVNGRATHYHEAGRGSSVELCVLAALRDALRRREVGVVGGRRRRSPETDLPADFDLNPDVHYAAIRQPLDPTAFVDGLRTRLEAAGDFGRWQFQCGLEPAAFDLGRHRGDGSVVKLAVVLVGTGSLPPDRAPTRGPGQWFGLSRTVRTWSSRLVSEKGFSTRVMPGSRVRWEARTGWA